MRLAIAVGLLALLGACNQSENAAKKAVGDLLSDPESAQFRDLKSYPLGKGERVCGEVNAKNRMGGYVGFVRFVVDLRGPTAWIDPGRAELSIDHPDSVAAYADGLRFDRRFQLMCSEASTTSIEPQLRSIP